MSEQFDAVANCVRAFENFEFWENARLRNKDGKESNAVKRGRGTHYDLSTVVLAED